MPRAKVRAKLRLPNLVIPEGFGELSYILIKIKGKIRREKTRRIFGVNQKNKEALIHFLLK